MTFNTTESITISAASSPHTHAIVHKGARIKPVVFIRSSSRRAIVSAPTSHSVAKSRLEKQFAPHDVHQVVQPVIHVSADARSAKIRARLFQMGGPSGGEGSWISGIYENTSVNEDGTWKLSGMDLDYI